ncbi:MAG TPA: hypothetical protein DCO93_05615, partial [Clostridiales bacterium]|nr:hypothetical protein [Clostridiales bacterium]
GLTSGKVQVTVKSGGDDINSVPTEDESTPTIDHEFEEAGTTEYRMIEPGNYMVVVKVNEKADGKIDFIVRSDEEGEENAPTTEEQATTE